MHLHTPTLFPFITPASESQTPQLQVDLLPVQQVPLPWQRGQSFLACAMATTLYWFFATRVNRLSGPDVSRNRQVLNYQDIYKMSTKG